MGDEGLPELERQAARLRAAGDHVALADVLGRLVETHLDHDDVAGASAAAREQLEVRELLGDPWMLQGALRLVSLLSRDDHQLARDTAERCVAICRENGWTAALLNGLLTLGDAWRRIPGSAADEQAFAVYAEMDELATAQGDWLGVAQAAERRCRIVASYRLVLDGPFVVQGGSQDMEDRVRELSPIIERGLEAARVAGDEELITLLLAHRTDQAAHLGDATVSASAAEDLAALADADDDRATAADALVAAGVAAARLGDGEQAERLIRSGIRRDPQAGLAAYRQRVREPWLEADDRRAILAGVPDGLPRLHLESALLSGSADPAPLERAVHALADGETVFACRAGWVGPPRLGLSYDAALLVTDHRLLWATEHASGSVTPEAAVGARLERDGVVTILHAGDLLFSRMAPDEDSDDEVEDLLRRIVEAYDVVREPDPVPADVPHVRVFVSSTFRDMREERDLLLHEVFPRLRHLYEERGVLFSDVDLRWGVTDEQAADGQVLPICLEEIERCRPYFIGLLGERYGWIPDTVPPTVAEQHGWLGEYPDRSVTELEIIHGVLRRPDMAGHASFYLRDPAYLDRVEPGRIADFAELATGTDPGSPASPELEQEAAARRARLARLKDEIRGSGFPVHDGYRDPRELATLVLEDFRRLLDQLYPEPARPDPGRREMVRHRAFAQQVTRAWVRPDATVDRLTDAVAAGTDVVVSGDSGSGRSALLAGWAAEQGARDGADVAGRATPTVLCHFADASPDAADPGAALAHLAEEAQRLFGSAAAATPEGRPGPRAEAALRHLAARGPVVVVVDDADRLATDPDRGPLGSWVAWVPDEVRLVLSGPTHLADDLAARGRPVQHVTIQPLADGERVRLVEEYLRFHTKSMDADVVRAVADHPLGGLPLFPRTLLDELMVSAEHHDLRTRLEDLLGARSVDDLFERIYARWERDLEGPHRGLVGSALGLLWAARSGLTEPELLDLLGQPAPWPATWTTPLPRAAWAPLRHAAAGVVRERGSLLRLAHEHARRAVEDRYLGAPGAKTAVHARVGKGLLRPRPVTAGTDPPTLRFDPTDHALEEGPWQLAEGGEWERLHQVMTAPECLRTMATEAPAATGRLWQRLEQATGRSPSEDLRVRLESRVDRDGVEMVGIGAFLLASSGRPEEAATLMAAAVDAVRDHPDDRVVTDTLVLAAQLSVQLGEAREASDRLEVARRRAAHLGDPRVSAEVDALAAVVEPMLAVAVPGATPAALPAGPMQVLADAVGLVRAGRAQDALRLTEDGERRCTEAGDPAGARMARFARLTVLLEVGRPEECLSMSRELRTEAERADDEVCAAMAETIEAGSLHRLGRDDEASATFARALDRVGGEDSAVGRVLAGQADALLRTGPTGERLREVLAAAGVSDDLAPAVARALPDGAEPLAAFPYVGSVLREDAALVATDRGLTWCHPAKGLVAGAPWAEVTKVVLTPGLSPVIEVRGASGWRTYFTGRPWRWGTARALARVARRRLRAH